MLAMIFPGQGSQSVGMLCAWGDAAPAVRDTFSEASSALGYDLWGLVQSGPPEKLDQTVFTQPALLTAGVALYRMWQERTVYVPRYLAGHSLGEYTALVCAGVLRFQDAVKCVEMRGRFMQEAVPSGVGAMAAIVGLTASQVESLCKAASAQNESVVPANYNADEQIVIAGHSAAVDRAMALALEKGAMLAKKLPMSVPSHCALMEPATKKLEAYLASLHFNAPVISVIHNVDVEEHASPNDVRQALVSQLRSPVRWTDTIKKMQRLGVTQIVECGPGKVLTGLCKRITPALQYTASLNTPEDFQAILAAL